VKISRGALGGLAVLAASLLLFGLTFQLKDNPLVPIGPGFYPRIVLGITIALSLWVVIFEYRNAAQATKEDLNYTLVALMFAAFGLYCGVLGYLGFRLATALYIAGANAMLDPPSGVKGWLRVAAVAIPTALITHLIFERYLTVLLPRGTWTGF
jgi:putative tricarboxylic transport membrane protein